MSIGRKIKDSLHEAKDDVCEAARKVRDKAAAKVSDLGLLCRVKKVEYNLITEEPIVNRPRN